MPHRHNPFSLTKAVDLSDSEILSLWVDVTGAAEVSRPSSPMPSYILGGKGSGKTHLMRYHSLPVQALRAKERVTDLEEMLALDKYVGIYARFGGLNAKKFSGKGRTAEFWEVIFAYYIELWALKEVIRQLDKYSLIPRGNSEELFCSNVVDLFDKWPGRKPRTVDDLNTVVATLLRQIDYFSNNVIWNTDLTIEVLATRGELIFGIPSIIQDQCSWASECVFVYSLDEIEHLDFEQQKVINTWVSERRTPATFRIGCRTYGVKTLGTLGGNEKIVEGSEYEAIYLDQRLRTSRKFETFAARIVGTRLKEAGILGDPLEEGGEMHRYLVGAFEMMESAWDSIHFLDVVKHYAPEQRPYFHRLATLIEANRPDGDRTKGKDRDNTRELISYLQCEQYPVIEKLNCMLLFRAWRDGKELNAAAETIKRDCAKFLEEPKTNSKYKSVLEHFKSDLIAQLYRECGRRPNYYGWKVFVDIAEGLPRSLLVILRNIYDWAAFEGEQPFVDGKISRVAQDRGVQDASSWFFESMREAGRIGTRIEILTERLAELLRANRFSDTPVECSVLSFAAPLKEVNGDALELADLARDRSFLIEVRRGHRDKNSGRIFEKFRLNRMLAPKWDLPTGSRGTFTMNVALTRALFDTENSVEWRAQINTFNQTHSAPFSGVVRTAAKTSQDTTQVDLFGGGP